MSSRAEDSRAAFAVSAMRAGLIELRPRPRRTWRAKMSCCLKNSGGRERFQGIVETLPGIDIASDLVELQEIALRHQR